MARTGLGRYFLSPPGSGPGYGKLPVLLRGGRRWRVLLLILIGVMQAALTVIMAIGVKQVFDEIGQKSLQDMMLAMIAPAAALIASGFLRWREFVESERLAQAYVHAVRLAIFRHAIRLGVAGIGQTSRSVILLRFTGDLGPIRLWISRGLLRGLVGSLSAVLTLSALVWIEPIVGGAVTLIVGLTAIAAVSLGAGLDKRTRRLRRRRTAMLKHVQDRLLRLSVVEAQGRPREERRIAGRFSRRVAAGAVAQGAISGAMRALGETGGAAASLVAIFVGAALVGLGLTTAGGIVAVMLIVGLLAPKIADVTRALEYWTGARIAVEKQAKLLSLKPVGRRRGASASSLRLRRAEGRLELANVSYRDLVSDVSLTLLPGERFWLGTQLSPRSGYTVLQIAAGIIQPTRGTAKLDGANLVDLHRSDLRRNVALASSRLELVPGPLRASLVYGLDKSRAGLLDLILAMHGLADVFSSLPGGLDYVVSDDDQQISPGQKLLVGVIRARLADVRIMLIDQGDVPVHGAETQAIRTILDDYEVGVLWASPLNPLLDHAKTEEEVRG